MKAKKWIIAALTALMCLCLGLFVSACGEAKNYGFEDYGYNNGTNENDWTKLEYPDTDITVDGVVNTTEYGDKFLSFSDVNGINMKVYAHMGQEGVFFGFVSDDTAVFYDAKDVYNNTSIEIQVAPAGTEKLNPNVVQLRLGANGYAEQWVGMKAHDTKYDYTRKYIPSMGRIRINGQLNSAECEGYSMEIYMPYTSLNLDSKPDSIVCAPSFNTKAAPGDSRATWTMMLGCDLGNPATWYVVDETGMTSKSSGFDDSDPAAIEQKGGGNEFYYLDNLPKKAYYVETVITQHSFLNGDNWPKFGLVNKSEEALITLHVDAANRNGKNFGKVRAVQSTNSGTSWLWDTSASTSFNEHWGANYIGDYSNMKLGLIYLDGNLYMLLDDKLVFTEKNYSVADGAIPGFMCFNTEATFSNTQYITDETQVRAKAAQYIAKSVTIDGDFSDWEALDNWDEINASKLTKTDATRQHNSMTVYSFLGDDGLYIRYDVSHMTLLPVKKWDDGWWLNTNIELFIGGNKEVNHFALTSFGSGGYMDAVMTTSAKDNENNCYYTDAEIFIPFSSLEAYTSDVTEVEVGFAFKSDNGTDDAKLNGDAWWFFDGTPNSYMYKVSATGISKSEPDEPEPIITKEYALEVDGNISDWATAGITKTVGAHGQNDGDKHKSVTFYAVLEKRGMFIAVDSYHDLYTYAQGEWHQNTNIEFYGTTGGVLYVTSSAKDTYTTNESYIEQKVITTAVNETGKAKFHTVAEIFLPMDRINSWIDEAGFARLGIAFKTNGDNMSGTGTGYGNDSWWAPYGAHPNNGDYKTYVTENGIYLKYEYEKKDSVFGATSITAEKTYTIDGDLSDWNGVDKVSITGTEDFAGKKADFYGSLTTTGLYLAADVYYGKHTHGEGNWWMNTNFEFFLGQYSGGGPRQCYVYATGDATFAASNTYMQIGTKTEMSGSLHHTVIEVFIPIANLVDYDYTVIDGAVRVGVAWKTAGDQINNGADGNGTSEYWLPLNTKQNNADMCYVSASGIYTRSAYEAKG